MKEHFEEAILIAHQRFANEQWWIIHPNGCPFAVIYGYMKMTGEASLDEELMAAKRLLGRLAFNRDVVETFLPQLFKQEFETRPYIDIVKMVNRDNITDEEIIFRVMDISLGMWDDRFITSLDTMKNIITNSRDRGRFGMPKVPGADSGEKPKDPDWVLAIRNQRTDRPVPPRRNASTFGLPPDRRQGVNKDDEEGYVNDDEAEPIPPYTPHRRQDEDKESEEPHRTAPVELFKVRATRMRLLRHNLSGRIFGQENAVSQFVEGLFRTLMVEDERKKGGPRGIFFLAGPPGVGKTYMAETAAELLHLPYKRFNMSEYSSKTDYFQLIGTDPSYRNGHAGVLSVFVKKNPKSVLIFDEIEKAGPRVHNIFLQILGAGEYDDDHLKETISLRDAIIIFTSNAGSSLYDNRSGSLSTLPQNLVINAIRQEKSTIDEERPLINPALLSRLAGGNVIFFDRVGQEALLLLTKKGFDDCASKYSERLGVPITYDDKLPLLFMYNLSNMLDARVATHRSGIFMEKEFYELARQLENRSDLLDGISEIRFQITIPDDGEIKSLFVSHNRQEFLVICGGDVKDKLPQETENSSLIFADISDLDDIEDIEAQAIFIDPYLGMEGLASRPIGIEDAASPGIRLFRSLMDSGIQIPVYLIDTDGHISQTDRESFMRLGAADVINVDHEDIAERLDKLASILYIESQYKRLSGRGYVLDYDTSLELSEDGKTLVVSYYDMWKTQAMDETTGQLALKDDERPDTRFDDVIGGTAAKEELKYYTEYLREPVRFLKRGIKPPKGLLLYGPPGTGKTMLARALAGEAQCSFFAVSASNLFAPHLGESEENIRQLFARARKYAPSVIFIDEIDAIGTMRLGNSSDGRESALNTLLTEMDGFMQHKDKPVFVLAATNFGIDDDGKSALDEALLRRFDNRVYVGLPKKAERLEYLERAYKGAGCISEDALKSVADRTTGQSLSMLSQVISLAERKAFRNDEELSDKALIEALDEYLYGEEREQLPEYYEKTAIHEAGHAYIAYMGGLTPGFMTIVSRGGFGGYMAYDNLENKREYTRDELLCFIRTALAGRCAEREFYDDSKALNTGADSDLMKATQRALSFIIKHGMKEDTILSIKERDISTLPEYGRYLKEANELLLNEEKECRRLIKDGRDKVRALADALCEQSFLTREQILSILER